jgi:hypothetical protein
MATTRKPARILAREAKPGDKYRVAIGGREVVDPILSRRKDGTVKPLLTDMVYGIEGPDGFEARPGLTKTAVDDLVARLNEGLPVSKEKRGIGKKPKRAEEPARWAEILLSVPETRAQLLDAKARGSKLSPAFVRELMTFHSVAGDDGRPLFGGDGHPGFPLPTDEDAKRKLTHAVGKQLARVLELETVNWRDT